MSKPSPTWQDLPAHFKRDVVGYLNLKSRLRLALTSKWHLDLVNSCPPHFIYHITISLFPRDTYYPPFVVGLKEADDLKTIHKYFDSTEEAIGSFSNFLNHQKTKFQKFEILCGPGSYCTEEECLNFFEDVEKILSEKINRRGGKTIQTRQLIIGHVYDVEDQIQEILNCFKADTVILHKFST